MLFLVVLEVLQRARLEVVAQRRHRLALDQSLRQLFEKRQDQVASGEADLALAATAVARADRVGVEGGLRDALEGVCGYAGGY